MGAIGIARAFLHPGQNRSIEETLEHFEKKLLRLYERLHTETARELGAERHRLLLEFYRRLKAELSEP